MSAALVESPPRLFAGPARVRGGRAGGGPTLEEHLKGAWRALEADHDAGCPVCGGRMTLAQESGRCGECGSRLS